MKVSITPAQQIFLKTYDAGLYAHIAPMTGEVLDHHLNQIQDPLVLCMMVILDQGTGCQDLDDAYERLFFAANEIDEALLAVVDELEKETLADATPANLMPV